MKAIRDLTWKEKQSRTLSRQSLYHTPTESENSLFEGRCREEGTCFLNGNKVAGIKLLEKNSRSIKITCKIIWG